MLGLESEAARDANHLAKAGSSLALNVIQGWQFERLADVVKLVDTLS